MSILLLFNDKNEYSFKDLFEKLNTYINCKSLQKHLQSLVKFNILQSSIHDIKNNTKICLNLEYKRFFFTSKFYFYYYYLKINAEYTL